MTKETPFLLVIEIESGYNTYSLHSTFEEAVKAKKISLKKEESPICIYDLVLKKMMWEDEEFPDYRETIYNSIIKKLLK